MNCDEVRELLAAYALDALTEGERIAVRDHLASCELHAELAEISVTAEALAALAEEVEPPVSLRVRVLSTATDLSSKVVSVRSESRRRRSMLVPWSLAAAVAAFAIALGWWSTAREGQAPARVSREATAVSGASHGRVTYVARSKQLVFEVEALAPAPAGMTYQLWVVRGSTPVSLGVFAPTAAGHGAVTVKTTLVEGETLAVTVEPAGGSPAPTSAPFLLIKI